MANNCSIIRNDRGQIISTEAPNGERSMLFDSLVNKLQEPAEALKVWLVSKTREFTERVMNPIKSKQRSKLVSIIKDNVNSDSKFSLVKTKDMKTINLNIKGDESGRIGRIRFKEKEPGVLSVDSSLLYVEKRQGYGTQLYLGLFQYALSTNSSVRSSEKLSPDSKGVWDKMVRLGLAEETNSGVYTFNDSIEGLDSNGEPMMEVLLNYIDNRSTIGETVSINEVTKEQEAELKDIMMGLRVKSSAELTEKLKQGFMPEGYFNPNRLSLNSINLYNGEEITDILTNTELQENIRDFIYNLNSLDGEVLNDIYSDDNFMVVKDGTKNSIGKFKLANPYLVEKKAVEVLGGFQTRSEFEDVLFNDESVSLLATPYLESQGTKDDLFKQFKSFKKIAELAIDEGNLTVKQNNTREVLEQVLVEPENTQLEDNLKFLIDLDGAVYTENPEATKKLINEVAKGMMSIGIDTTGLQDTLKGKSIGELREFLDSVYTFITTESDQAFDNLVGAYNEFFDVSEDFKFKKVPLSDNISTDNSFYLESGSSDISLFNKNGLIPIGKNIYKRVSKTTPVEELYDKVYFNTVTNGYNNILSEEAFRPSGYDSDGTLDLSKITDPNNKQAIIRDMRAFIQAQVAEIYVGNEVISQEELERYALMFNYLNKSSDLNKFTDKPVIDNEYSIFMENIENQDYLQTDFIADFYKKYLKEKSKNSLEFTEFYSNFEINNNGIKLANTDPISLSSISKYLDNNRNIVNYLKLHKKGINLEPASLEDPIRDDLFMRNFYTNFPTAVQVFKGSYNKLSNKTLIAESKESFLRLGDGVYELIHGIGNKGVYGKLYVQDGIYKNYSTSLRPPVLDIDVSELSAIDANINPQVELNNIYSEEEKTKIDNEHDNC